MSDYAVGLPDRGRFDPINPTLKGMTRVVFQKHDATNLHYDMRILDGDKLHSFVSRSLPGEKDKFLLVQQPTHRADYIDFEGTIPSGYGAGTVEKAYDAPADIIKANDKHIHMVLPEGEFSAVRTHGRNWLMLRRKNTLPGAITHKPELKTKGVNELAFDNTETVLQPKIDGGHTVFRLSSDGINRCYSNRVGKGSGEVIEHTHQLPEFRDMEVPKAYDGVELRGEVYARSQGGPLAPEAVGGLLNAGTFISRERQAVVGRLQPYPFKVVKWKGGVDVENAPYEEHLSMLQELTSKVKGLFMPETASTPKEKESLFRRIRNKEHPDTVEGVVEWHLKRPGGNPHKIKLRDTHEVVIRNVFPADSKKPIAGGFEYSWTKDSPVVGRVGTGFSEAMRRRMLSNPEEFVGGVARVKSQKVYSSGAMRYPSFYAMHIEKNAANLIFSIGKETAGVARKDMPQIPKGKITELVRELKGDGVKVTEKKVDPDTLKPTQTYIDSTKVKEYEAKAVGAKPILVAQDNRIIDGHHQWAKALELDKDVNIVKINLPIKKALAEAKEFAKAAFFDELNRICSNT